MKIMIFLVARLVEFLQCLLVINNSCILLLPLLQYILIFLRQGNYRHELMIMVALSMVITQVGLLLFIKDLY